MCEGFKYGPHVSAFLLLIVFVLFCIASSGTEDKMIVIQEKGCHYYNYSCQYNYYWYSVGWKIDDWDDKSCVTSGLIFGSLCIISAIITFCSVIMLLYFRINLKNYEKVFDKLYQRQFIIITCIILMALTGPSAGLFFSNCSDVLWDENGPIWWAPDYGLIMAWVGCGILIIIPFFNLNPWIEETKNSNNITKHQHSDQPKQVNNDSTMVVVVPQSIPVNDVDDDPTCLNVAAGFSIFIPVIGFTMMCVYACGKNLPPKQAQAYKRMVSCTALGFVVGCIVSSINFL